MTPMKRIRTPMHRYGEADFDRDYLRWGFHDADTQLKEAESILRLAGNERRLRILDLACGMGRHAVYWAGQGHTVTAVDLSETFVAEGRRLMRQAGVAIEFIVSDIRSLPYREAFDVVTWIENSFFDEDMIRQVNQCLVIGGILVLDVRNPENAKARFRQSNWRTWREEAGVFYLERHETDERTGSHEDVWITIDSQHEVIEEKINTTARVPTLEERIHSMKTAGFSTVELRTMEGLLHTGGTEPYWLWLVGTK
ncbi:MAG: class I SAM-dependent methyltransferase [Chloroflexi bacterium]|nr:class I SAM-dependent methyltransferase [Chloroflexota bacterium]